MFNSIFSYPVKISYKVCRFTYTQGAHPCSSVKHLEIHVIDFGRHYFHRNWYLQLYFPWYMTGIIHHENGYVSSWTCVFQWKIRSVFITRWGLLKDGIVEWIPSGLRCIAELDKLLGEIYTWGTSFASEFSFTFVLIFFWIA